MIHERDEAIELCLGFPNAYEDYPFHDDNWTVMRHGNSRRVFALIFRREGALWMNLKAEPVAGEFWQGQYEAIRPAYHMNKQHWIGVCLNGTVPDETVAGLVADSFRLTEPPKARQKAKKRQ